MMKLKKFNNSIKAWWKGLVIKLKKHENSAVKIAIEMQGVVKINF